MITKSQFRRGLSDLGLSALGQHRLTDSQFEALCKMYSSAKMPDKVLWTRFMEDIESGKNLDLMLIKMNLRLTFPKNEYGNINII